MRLPFSDSEMLKLLRYQPVPPVVKPPLTWLIALGSKGELLPGRSSMLQSCGRSSLLHPESSKSTASAPCAPPLWKRQSKSNNTAPYRSPSACASAAGKGAALTPKGDPIQANRANSTTATTIACLRTRTPCILDECTQPNEVLTITSCLLAFEHISAEDLHL